MFWIEWLAWECTALWLVVIALQQFLRWNDRVFRRKIRELVPELRDATDAEVDRYIVNAEA